MAHLPARGYDARGGRSRFTAGPLLRREVHAIAPALLRPAHGRFGPLDQEVAVLAGAALGDADRDGDLGAAHGARHVGPEDGAAHPLRDPRGRGERHSGNDQQELVAAVAHDGVADAQRARERLPDRPQHVVADGVTARIVQPLQPVDVDRRQRQDLEDVAPRRGHLGDHVVEAGGAEGARHRVQPRQAGEPGHLEVGAAHGRHQGEVRFVLRREAIGIRVAGAERADAAAGVAQRHAEEGPHRLLPVPPHHEARVARSVPGAQDPAVLGDPPEQPLPQPELEVRVGVEGRARAAPTSRRVRLASSSQMLAFEVAQRAAVRAATRCSISSSVWGSSSSFARQSSASVCSSVIMLARESSF